jgi:hypothetical protein
MTQEGKTFGGKMDSVLGVEVLMLEGHKDLENQVKN